MFHLIKLSDFLREVSHSPRLKFDLAGLSFAGLVVPTALLISIGAPEEYALPLMMIAILPFQYILVCILRMRRDGRLEENRPMVGPPLIRSSLREKTEIKVIGLGSGGSQAINRLIDAGLKGVEFIFADTDISLLHHSLAPVKIQIGANLTKGLGTGADPEIGRKAALEDTDKFIGVLEGSDMVIIVAGLGGGTGTGAAPIVASLANELGLLTAAVVTRPFSFEGDQRMQKAADGVSELADNVDTLIISDEGNSFHDRADAFADALLRLATGALVSRDFSTEIYGAIRIRKGSVSRPANDSSQDMEQTGTGKSTA